ncbi:MAG: YoaK family protein, partial [Lachnospiraceae bacterium]|nr:YoaK family protein [Lachnospiraceae bacterium]
MRHHTEALSQNDTNREFFLECEKHWVFWSLILVGGFYGAYTFMARGGVFCNAQTANIVLLSMAIGSRDWEKALYLLIPISAYFMGAILSEFLAKKV